MLEYYWFCFSFAVINCFFVHLAPGQSILGEAFSKQKRMNKRRANRRTCTEYRYVIVEKTTLTQIPHTHEWIS